MLAYSVTPLVKKLGIKEGMSIYVKNPPMDYVTLLGGLPDNVHHKTRIGANLDFIHFFTKSQKELKTWLPKAKMSIKSDGIIWVSWPKKAAKVATDMSEDYIREVCLPMDLVDIKVCAVDETWSGLKLVIRKEKRS